MPKHDHLEALGGMNIMLNKTARAGVSEEYHQAFFDPFYPVIGAVGALVLICIVAAQNVNSTVVQRRRLFLGSAHARVHLKHGGRFALGSEKRI